MPDPGKWKSWLLRRGLALLSSTWRIREHVPSDCASIVRGEEPAIVVFWHGKMFPVWYRFRGRGCAALISASRDGELLAGYLEHVLGYREVIRGSSSKGGSQALAEMTDVARRRTCLITPDGPRGPRGAAKPGALVAAVRTGRRVMLAGWSSRRVVRLSSWDRMEIPYPFSVVDFRYCIFEVFPHDHPSSGSPARKHAVERSAPRVELGDIEEDIGDADVEKSARVPDAGTFPTWRIEESDLLRLNAALDRISQGER